MDPNTKKYKPKNDTSTFSKFETSLVSFFNFQFDDMREDEKQDVREGLVSDCDTISIVAINLFQPNTGNNHCCSPVLYLAGMRMD
jgi:hypothetical protein